VYSRPLLTDFLPMMVPMPVRAKLRPNFSIVSLGLVTIFDYYIGALNLNAERHKLNKT